MKLSVNFTLKEMISSQVAEQNKINNHPNYMVIEALQETCVFLEQIRMIWGGKMQVLSGFRSKILNEKVGGSKTSMHMQGRAVDIYLPEEKQEDFLNKLWTSKIRFDQIIFYPHRNFVHLSYNKASNRNELLRCTGNNIYEKI